MTGRGGSAGSTTALAALVGLVALGACGGDDEPRCRIAQAMVLPSLATSAPTGWLDLARAGEDFLLLSREEGAAPTAIYQFRMQRLSAAGTAAAERTAAVSQASLTPLAAATQKTVPGDQLVVVHPASAVGDGFSLQTTVAGEGSASLSRPLLDPDGQPVVVPGSSTSMALGTSRSGSQAVLAWGDVRRPDPPQILRIKGDGATERISLAGAPGTALWDCLSIVPGRHDFAIQRVLRPADDDPTWLLLDLRDDGSVAYSLQVPLPLEGSSCPRVAPTATGYAVAWQNRQGSYFSDITTDGRPQPFVTTDIVRSAVHFGGPDRQPPISCIAFMGRDYGLLFAPSSGPLVHRFDVFGVPKGGQLHLPSRGRIGPLAAWPEVGSAFVTYFELGATPAEHQRHFVKVDCP